MSLSPLIILAALIQICTADYLYPNARDGNGNPLAEYTPARPPAVPLAVRSPYTSAWLTTGRNSSLNSGTARFWTGQAVGWEGIVAVDGVSYEYLGVGSQSLPIQANLTAATPQRVAYDSQYSNFTFIAGPVEITASFFSPVTPTDLCRISIPLSYLSTTARSRDNQSHAIQFYSDINAAWTSYENDKDVVWDLHRQTGNTQGNNTGANSTADIFSWLSWLRQPYYFGEQADFPQWGNFSYSSGPMGAKNFSFESGYASDIRSSFVSHRSLQNSLDGAYRGWGVREPVFAFAHDAGLVKEATVRYAIGSIQAPIMRYINHGGVTALRPWWEKCYGSMYDMIKYHWNDFQGVQNLANDFEIRLRVDVGNLNKDASKTHTSRSENRKTPDSTETQLSRFYPNSGYDYMDFAFKGTGVPNASETQAHYAIVALSARQVMAANAYAVPPPTSSNKDDPLVFQKEISSSGNVNTVDVLYPGTPFFVWANPELLRLLLEPIFENQEGTFYPNGYSMHDLGTHFPNATGHVEGNDEYMPIEESGNLILMSYAYYRFSNNTAWISKHYVLLKQFAKYLSEFSLIPSGQLSTDDFAGTLTNQTNLALKGIIGLKAMAKIAEIAGQNSDSAAFNLTASEYYKMWETLGVDPTKSHTTLAYEWRSSWGLLYNSYMDKLLDLGVVKQWIYDMQSQWYPQVSQVYGVPLDNRHHYTKSDWMMWTAATCAPATRRMFVTSLAYWLNSTTTPLAFTDLFETIGDGYFPQTPNYIEFKARPVAGGHFALLALGAASK